MKKIITVAIVLITSIQIATAQNGYSVTIQLKDATAGKISISVYKGSPAFSFKIDSVLISKPDQVVKFAVSKKILGGIYRLELNGNKQNSKNIILDNGKKISGSISASNMATLTCTDSLNTLFLQLQQPGLANTDKEKYLKKIQTKYPLSAAALYARVELKKIEAAGYTGTIERLKIIDKYFSGIALDDKRIQLLPNIYSYLFEYIKLTPIGNDSYQKNVDRLLKNMSCSSRNYIFYLDWIFKNIKYYEKSDLNQAFKYVYEKYLNTTQCSNVNKDFYAKLSLEVAALSNLKPGVQMPDIAMQDSSGKAYTLKELYDKSQYTLFILYDPFCDHCKIVMPEIATFFSQKNYPESLVKLVAFRNTQSKNKWQDFIKESHLEKWLNAEPLKGDKKYMDTLKAYSNPMYFLIDRQGYIVQRKYDANTYSKLFTQ